MPQNPNSPRALSRKENVKQRRETNARIQQDAKDAQLRRNAEKRTAENAERAVTEKVDTVRGTVAAAVKTPIRYRSGIDFASGMRWPRRQIGVSKRNVVYAAIEDRKPSLAPRVKGGFARIFGGENASSPYVNPTQAEAAAVRRARREEKRQRDQPATRKERRAQRHA